MFVRAGAAVVAVCSLAGGARAAEVVGWRDAAQCVGRVCGLRGTVAASEADGPTTRLHFDPQDRTVRVLLMHGWLVTWPAYDGREIIATGKVDRFRDHIEMILLDPDDIEVVGGLPSPTASAPLSPTPSVAPPTPSVAPPTATASVAAPTPLPATEPATAPPPPATATEPAAAPTPPPMTAPAPTAAGEVEQLRQRVRELEERVRELEE